MNKKHEIRYSDVFYKDLDLILNYIKCELNNIEAANRLFDEIIKEISNRALNPKLYEKYITKRNTIYYRIYVKKYTIFYIVKDNIMEVRRILYSKRRFNKLV